MLRSLKGRRRKLWILLGCAIAVVLILMLWREREPRFEDHSLLEWIAIADRGDRDHDYSEREGLEAVRHIGTNAIPFLIKCIEYRERPWQTRLGSLCSKLPEKVARPLTDLVVGHGAQQQAAAFSGLYILGPDAKPAIPALTNLLLAQPPLPQASMTILVQIGGDGLTPILNIVTDHASPDRLIAIGALVGLSTNRPLDQVIFSTLTNCLADTNRELAFYAAQILCCHDSEKELAMKTLIDGLGSENKKLRWSAVSGLTISLKHGYSVPALLQFLHDTNSPLSPYCASALGELAYHYVKLPETVLPALTIALRDSRPLVRSYAVSAIGHFREAAEPAAPALLDALNDPDEFVRLSATNAFYELPAYTVLMHPPPGLGGISEEQQEMYRRRYGIQPYKPTLIKLLDHPDIRIREMATNGLQKFKIPLGGNPSH